MMCGWGTAGEIPGPENTWNSHQNHQNSGPSGKNTYIYIIKYVFCHLYTNEHPLIFPFLFKCIQWNSQEENEYFHLYPDFLYRLWKQMPFLLHLCLFLKHHLLYTCVCKTYMQKNQNAKVSFRKVYSKTMTLSTWTPKEVDIVLLLKRNLLRNGTRNKVLVGKLVNQTLKCLVSNKWKNSALHRQTVLKPDLESGVGHRIKPCICIRAKDHALKVIKAVFSLASFLPYTWKWFCIS